MRGMFAAALAIAATAIGSSTASAQYTSVPIDTQQLVVKPVDTTTNILGGATKFVGRVAASAIDSNTYVTAINTLFGKKAPVAPTTQKGMSPLPLPSMYPSTQYKSPIVPALPQTQVFKR